MRRYSLIALPLAFLLAIAAGLWQLSRNPEFQLFGTLITRVETSAPVIALTFDDGPTPAYTDAVLETLSAFDVRATFYVTGRETDAHMPQARAIVAAGHALGNHSYTHRRLVLVSPATVRDELSRTDAAIRAAGYTGRIDFRPPYGKRLLVLPWVLHQQNRTTVTWDIAPETGQYQTAQEIAQYVLDAARPGSIVLMHLMYDDRETSRQALPLIITGLRERGFDFVTVPELTRHAQP